MQFNFKKYLELEERGKVCAFYYSLKQVSIEQHIEWDRMVNPDKAVTYFYAEDIQHKIVSCAIIKESGISPLLQFAEIQFGPLFSDPNSLLDAIDAIHSYYKKKKFFFLSVQLAYPTGSITDLVEYRLSKKFNVHYYWNRNNWSSLVINLKQPIESIFSSFSKGHKSSIKKASKEGLFPEEINTSTSNKLADIYHSMAVSRKITNHPLEFWIKRISEIFAFIEKEKCGFGLLIKDPEGNSVGGLIAIKQGETFRYYLGAADPEKKELPVLHLAIYEAIKIAKERGALHFDLWGYNHFVDESDPVYFINRFKKGFSEDYIFYPKKMYVSLMPLGIFVYFFLMKLKKLIK